MVKWHDKGHERQLKSNKWTFCKSEKLGLGVYVVVWMVLKVGEGKIIW